MLLEFLKIGLIFASFGISQELIKRNLLASQGSEGIGVSAFLRLHGVDGDCNNTIMYFIYTSNKSMDSLILSELRLANQFLLLSSQRICYLKVTALPNA